MELNLQLLDRVGQPAVEQSADSESAKSPKYLNGHRLPENERKNVTKEYLGVPLQELDPFYKKEKTFVVIGPGSLILYRYDGADTYLVNTGRWRSLAIGMVSHGIFIYTMILVVLLNCFLTVSFTLKVSKDSNEAHQKLAVQVVENGFLLVYIFEFILKAFAKGLYRSKWKFSYLRSVWGWSDLFIIITGLIMAFGGTSLYPFLGFRVFKLIPLHPGLLAAWDNIISRSFSKLRALLFYLIVIMYMLGNVGLQLYMGVMGHRCVKRFDANASILPWEEYIHYPENWWTNNDTNSIVIKLCGNASTAQACPSNYTCLNLGINPVREYIVYDNFFWAELQTIQMLFQDFKESICEKIWATTGFPAMFIYSMLCFFIGTFSIGAFVYAVIGKELESEFIKSNTESNQSPRAPHEPIRVWKLAKLRHGADAVTGHKAFEYLITIVIVVDVIVAGMENFEMRETNEGFVQTLFVTEKVIGVIYILEFILKLLTHGIRNYFQIGQNRFDFTIVLIFVVQTITDELPASIDLAYLYQLRALKLVPRWSALGLIFRVICNSISNSSIHLLSVLGILLFASAIFGHIKFSANYDNGLGYFPDQTMPRWNMTDFWHSVKLIFRTFCGEWVESLWDLFTISNSFWPLAYMLTSVLCSNFLITSIGITIMLTTKSALETDEPQPSTPFEQLFFSITWVWVKIPKRFCSESQNKSELLNQNGLENDDIETPPNVESPTAETSAIQQKLSRVVEHDIYITVTAILLIVTSLSLTAPESAGKTVLDIIFLVYFILDIGVRIVAYRCSKRLIGFWLILDGLILLDTFLTLVLTDSRNDKGYICLRSFRLLMLIPRVDRIKIVGYALCGQLGNLMKYLLAVFYIWFTFTLIGVSLFSGRFHKCLDFDWNSLDYRSLHQITHGDESQSMLSNFTSKELCNFNEDNTWNPAATNFDNVLQGFWALSQIVTFNGWIMPIQSAEDARGTHAQPHPESSPAAFLYFVAFVIFGVLYPFNIIFGVLITYLRTAGRLEILSTPAQIETIEAGNYNESDDKIAPKPESPLLLKIYAIVNSGGFRLGICAVIFVDTLLIAVDTPNVSDNWVTVALSVHSLILGIYTIELILKLAAWKQHYFTRWWNVLDFLVVLLSLLALILSDIIEKYLVSPGFLRIFRLVHLLRLESILSIQLYTLTSFRTALRNSFPALVNILLFYSTVYFSYAVLGMTLFKGELPNPDSANARLYFHTFESSMMSLFLMVTLSGWEGIYENGIRNQQSDCQVSAGGCDHTAIGLVYVFSFMAFTFLITVNLYLTLGLEIIEQLNLTDSRKGERSGDKLNHGNSDHDGLGTPKNDHETIELRDGFD